MKTYPSWMRRSLKWVWYETMSEFVRHLRTLPLKGKQAFGGNWSGALSNYTVEETFDKALFG